MRRVLVGISLVAALSACTSTPEAAAPPPTTPAPPPSSAAAADPAPLAALEQRFAARVGVYAVNTRTGEVMAYRADERFAMMSTFKTYAAAAVLDRGVDLDKRITYTAADLAEYAPVAKQRVATGMTVGELADAAVTVSDNTAANLLLRELGGPSSVTELARKAGDGTSRLDRYEPELNDVVLPDERDTTTPRGIATGYRALVLGTTLPGASRERLVNWLLGNKTGDQQIRAGVPQDWRVADKTGSAGNRMNDVAVTWTPDGTPIVMAILTSRTDSAAPKDPALIAEAAKAVATALS